MTRRARAEPGPVRTSARAKPVLLTGSATSGKTELNQHLSELFDTDNPDLPTAVLFLDLDGFKCVNDTAGHNAGDGRVTPRGQDLVRLVQKALSCPFLDLERRTQHRRQHRAGHRTSR